MSDIHFPDSWETTTFGDVLSYEQPTPYIVDSTEYDDSYKTPVLTAGKSFLLGYTNELDGIYEKHPVIIFDDFTTASKYVDFSFKVKSSAMKILRAIDGVNLKFLYYLMQVTECNHDSHKRYWISIYSKIPIRLPDKTTQNSIVNKIEELFSKIDKGIAELSTIHNQLDVYQLAVIDAMLNIHTDKIVQLADIVDDIKIGPFGSMLHRYDYVDNGIPIINPKHINNDSIIPDKKNSITKEKALQLSSYTLRENDIILGRRGEMGRCASISKNEENWVCGTGSMIIRLKTAYQSNFYAKVLSSPKVVNYLNSHATGTTMKNLNEGIVKNIPVPDLTVDEQTSLLNELDARLSGCAYIENTVSQALQKAETLRQSILKQAFEGKLV